MHILFDLFSYDSPHGYYFSVVGSRRNLNPCFSCAGMDDLTVAYVHGYMAAVTNQISRLLVFIRYLSARFSEVRRRSRKLISEGTVYSSDKTQSSRHRCLNLFLPIHMGFLQNAGQRLPLSVLFLLGFLTVQEHLC